MGDPWLESEGDMKGSVAFACGAGAVEGFSRFDFPEHEGKFLALEYLFHLLLTSGSNT